MIGGVENEGKETGKKLLAGYFRQSQKVGV